MTFTDLRPGARFFINGEGPLNLLMKLGGQEGAAGFVPVDKEGNPIKGSPRNAVTLRTGFPLCVDYGTPVVQVLD